MTGQEADVGFFSRLRWGPGSVATVVLVALAAAVMVVEGASLRDAVLETSGWLLVLIDVIIVAVKGMERITPKTSPPEDVVGSQAVVVIRVSPPRPGVVKVGNELWSAVSDEEIPEGTTVTVVGRDGLYLRVSRSKAQGKA